MYIQANSYTNINELMCLHFQKIQISAIIIKKKAINFILKFFN